MHESEVSGILLNISALKLGLIAIWGHFEIIAVWNHVASAHFILELFCKGSLQLAGILEKLFASWSHFARAHCKLEPFWKFSLQPRAVLEGARCSWTHFARTHCSLEPFSKASSELRSKDLLPCSSSFSSSSGQDWTSSLAQR